MQINVMKFEPKTVSIPTRTRIYAHVDTQVATSQVGIILNNHPQLNISTHWRAHELSKICALQYFEDHIPI